MERLARLLLVAFAVPACATPAYKDPPPDAAVDDGAEDAAANIARDGGLPRTDAGEQTIPRQDAETPTETAPDGGQVPLAASLPDWASPLLGRYAMRSYSFAMDGFREMLRTREYAVVDIVDVPGADPHVELRLRMCDSFAEGNAAETQVVHPELSTLRTHRVLFGNRSWATQAPDATDGFTRALPERCEGKAGSSVPKDPAQTWIAGSTCRCPTSIDVAPTLDDCRVFDQDQDRKPGSTLHLHPKSLLGDADLFVATINRSTFVNGTVGTDRHQAELQTDVFGFQLACEPAGCADISSTPTPCAAARNKAEFVKVSEPDGYDCARVIDEAATLFPNGLPNGPSSCP